jgi:hypothetical protein
MGRKRGISFAAPTLNIVLFSIVRPTSYALIARSGFGITLNKTAPDKLADQYELCEHVHK